MFCVINCLYVFFFYRKREEEAEKLKWKKMSGIDARIVIGKLSSIERFTR